MVEGLTDDKATRLLRHVDGFRPEEVDWDMSQNNYKVMIGGRAVHGARRRRRSESNRIGYALVWYYVDNGALFIRCFLPGSGAYLAARMRAFTVFAGYGAERNAGLPRRSDTRISLRPSASIGPRPLLTRRAGSPCRARKDPAAEGEHDAHEERDQDE